jgi:hypothetical protein
MIKHIIFPVALVGANAPGTRHQDINVGDAPIEVMVVELENEK